MKINLNDLLSYFKEQSSWITSQKIANYFSVSDRTVKTYINLLNDEYGNIIESSVRGYKLTDKNLIDIENVHVTPQSSEERIRYILNLLLKKNAKLDLYDLSATLYISEGTLKNDFSKMRKLLSAYDLKLINKRDVYHIEGSEKMKRKLIVSLFWEESENQIFNLNSIQKSFPHTDLHIIKQIISKNFNDCSYSINEYGLNNIILHLAVIISRLESHSANISKSIKKEDTATDNVRPPITDIIHDLESTFHVFFSGQEIDDIDSLFKSYTIICEEEKMDSTTLKQHIPNEYIQLADNLINILKHEYNIVDFDINFFTSFALHIMNLANRVQIKQLCRNPLKNSIKQSCPFIYDCAVILANKLSETIGKIDDDEITYIAFHIGNAIETQKKNENKIKAILFIQHYYSYNQNIISKILSSFSESLTILQVIHDKSELPENKEEFDFIITTTPIKLQELNICAITPFLTDVDMDKISAFVNHAKKAKKLKKFERNIRHFIYPDFFEKNHYFDNEISCISYICNILEKKNFVDKNFYHDILLREQMSSTAFNNVAIPHSMNFGAKKSAFYILLNDKPIHWNTKEVQIVFLLAVNDKDKKIFTELFDDLSMTLTDSDNFKNILECKNSEELLNLFLDRVLK